MSTDNKAAAALPIRVQGGEALSTRLLDLPATAKPKSSITVLTQIRGGVLVVSGKKTGYTLQVDWGDGGKPQLLENVGADKTPAQGTSAPASHTYAEPKTYTVRVWAYDATGSVASDERKITITDASPTASPAASQTKTTPAAKIATPSQSCGERALDQGRRAAHQRHQPEGADGVLRRRQDPGLLRGGALHGKVPHLPVE